MSILKVSSGYFFAIFAVDEAIAIFDSSLSSMRYAVRSQHESGFFVDRHFDFVLQGFAAMLRKYFL